MPGDRPGSGLLGRRNECAALDRLLEDVRAQHARVLVVRGEPGVGKTDISSRRELPGALQKLGLAAVTA